MAKVITAFEGEFQILDNEVSEEYMRERGIEILLSKGFTEDDIPNLDEDDYINAYGSHEFMEGRARERFIPSIILESGEERITGKPVYKYVNETYEQALLRESQEDDDLFNMKASN